MSPTTRPKSASRLFTLNEAAVLTRMPLKAVHNAIDKKTIALATGNRAGYATRLLDLRALMSLALERRLTERLAPDLRREIFGALADTRRSTVSIEGGLIKIDLREPRKELANSIRDLRRACELVHSDPDIKGGIPVFRGTRVQVHMIAELAERGSPAEELLEDYPSMTAEMLRLAPIYAAAYPVRGRPRRQSWHDRPPIYTERVKWSDLGMPNPERP